ncbi:polysaccharide deacetylase family protein [Zafaria sp. Z1313]|uniref:polysaccharide deacetylase family protein n=1 Tax=Zafaria sp. Z1313 TaxID=3423202 RepID=UPI003D30221E
MTSPRRLRLQCALAASAALALAACAPPAPVVVPDAALVPSALSARTAVGGEGLPEEMVPGLEGVSLGGRAPDVYGRWFAWPGHPGFAEAQRGVVTAAARDFAAAARGQASGVAELNVQPALTAASPEAVAVRLTQYSSLGGDAGSSYTTVWFQPGRGSLDTRALFRSGAAWEDFRGLVAEVLGQHPDVLPEAVGDLDDALLDSLNFDAAGNGQVEFDDGSVAPSTAGAVVAAVPSAALLPLLGDAGVAARAAGMAPSPVAGPAGDGNREDDGGAGGASSSSGGAASLGGAVDAALGAGPVDCAVELCVALTFDDGPGPHTAALLDHLGSHDARASFFVVGPHAARHPGLLRRAAAEGHEIGNHTWSHRALTALGADGVGRELGRTADAVAAATGTAPTLMRPPYGADDDAVNRLAHTPVVLWDVDSRDLELRDAARIADAAVESVRPGSIVLLHDVQAETVAAVPRILERLGAEGYRFVTVSELLASQAPRAGVAYEHGPRH